MKLRSLAFSIALAAPLALGVAPAVAAPIWSIDLHHHQTHFPPGGRGSYFVDVDNVGPTDSSGPIAVTVKLPSGFSRHDARAIINDFPVANIWGNSNEAPWSCPGSPGDTTVVCTSTSNSTIARHQLARSLAIIVNVAPGVSGEPTATATVQGGGAAKAATTVEPTPIDPTPAGFGIFAGSFTPDFYESDATTTERQAGAHPDLFVTPFDLNSAPEPTPELIAVNPDMTRPSASIRDLSVDLPPGFVGAPTAVSECPQVLFALARCPLSSQVGRFDLIVTNTISNPGPKVFQSALTTGVFNLSHPVGFASDIGLNINGIPAHVKVSLDPANRYAITSSVSDVNETYPVFSQKLTLWGVPADPSHDSERCPGFTYIGLENSLYPAGAAGGGGTKRECPTDTTPKPFLTVPSQCAEDNELSIHSYDSWEDTGSFGPEIDYQLPGKFTGCEKPRFDPAVTIRPTGTEANTPTGLDVSIKVPQNESPDALATPPIKSTVVTLPAGMTVSPSFADGLDGCTEDQIGLGTNDPVRCPDNSRIGEVSLSTPLLPEPAVGSMYLAKQDQNPFGSTFALYMAVHDTEGRGILIKIPGRIDLDPQSGRITTSFNQLPQFPFEDFTLKFRSGQRAPLINPPSCGSHRIEVQIATYAQPTDVVDASDDYEIDQGPGGSACPGDPATRPFAPAMRAGTLNPVAGAYSPFVFRLTRTDPEQEISRVGTVLPPGLLAKIAGVAECPEAAIASISTQTGAGAAELADPACPANSRIGTLSAGVGAGTGPNYFNGSVYLAGPYGGGPLSLVTVAPALAGPFDLGNVVVRVPILVDRETAQVRAVSDPFPAIVHGVLLRIRDVRLRVDRPETTLNPTSCAPMSVDGQINGAGGDVFTTADDSLFTTSNRFQVGECDSLGFAPNLTFRLKGGTNRGSFPAFSATLRARPGDANIARTTVVLPRSTFIEQGHIRTVCTRVQFAANECPAGSVYGSARATSPLFDEVLEGPVYLRSNGGERLLPDLVVRLSGKVDVVLTGFVDSVQERVRNTFNVIPDAPVTEFQLQMMGGKRGLLVNSRNLCKAPSRAAVRMLGHNGKLYENQAKLQVSCKKQAQRKHLRRQHRRRG